MKKLLLSIILVLLSVSLFGQAQFYKGITVGKGGNVVTIDSIIKSTTFIKFYEDATELLAIDTTTMLLHYIQRSDTSTMLSKYARKLSPVFTGVPKISSDTVATRAYARTYGGTGVVTISEVRDEINDSLDVVLRPNYAPIADTMTYPGAGIALSTGTAWGTSVTDNSTNWNTAYSDRMKWDGGATGLTAATGRTSLGATTVGSAFFTMTNPSAITFPRINADNTITTRSVTEVKTDLSLGNVTNESKATMFTSPTFTGTVTIPTPFTLGAVSVTSTGTQFNYLSGTTGTTGTGNVVLSAAPTITGHPTIEGITPTGATGTGNMVFSASPTFTGTVSGITSTMVSLGNLTNKLQIEAEDSVNYPLGYMSRYDGVTGLAAKVAIADTSGMLTPYVNRNDTTSMLTNYITTAEVNTRFKSYTASLTAGVEANVTLTGVTAEPYSVLIFDENGLNITEAVKDSTAISGGVYHTYIYSVDAKNNIKVKVLW